MTKALIYKEWLKTRGVVLLALLVCAAMSAYTIAVVNRMITLQGVGHLWMIMLLKDNMFVAPLTFIPLACGVGVALAQTLPETSQLRFRLALHLPYSNLSMLLLMLGTGIVELTLIFAIPVVAIACYFSSLVPAELVCRALGTIAPWLVAGYIGYIFTFAAVIEQAPARRIIIALLGAAAVSVCFLQSAPEAYTGMFVAFVIFVIAMAVLPIGSMLRFKEGAY